MPTLWSVYRQQARSHLEHPLLGLVMSSFSVKNILSLPESCLQSCSNTTTRVPNICQGANLSPERPTGSNCIITAMPPSAKSQDSSSGMLNSVSYSTLFKFLQDFLPHHSLPWRTIACFYSYRKPLTSSWSKFRDLKPEMTSFIEASSVQKCTERKLKGSFSIFKYSSKIKAESCIWRIILRNNSENKQNLCFAISVLVSFTYVCRVS